MALVFSGPLNAPCFLSGLVGYALLFEYGLNAFFDRNCRRDGPRLVVGDHLNVITLFRHRRLAS